MKIEIVEKVIEKLEKEYPDLEWECHNIQEAILETIGYIRESKKKGG